MIRLPAALVPLRHPTFRALWIAQIFSNTGMWVQNTGAGWLMTSLAPAPEIVSLVQVASTLPVFLFALPAGALADIVDRRFYLMTAQCWMVAIAVLLAITTYMGLMTPWLLLGFTFAVGSGNAVSFPGWSATTSQLVPRRDLPQAIVLGGIGFNLTRTIGPAIGGFIIAWAGTEGAFVFNAIGASILLGAVLFWRRPADAPSPLPQEHFLSAMRSGLRFVTHSPIIRATMLRSTAFFFFGAAVWSLLPLVVRQRLGLGPEAFGVMLGAMGAGAVMGGLLLPGIRERLGRSRTVLYGSLLGCCGLILLGLATHWLPAMIGLMAYGVAWISTASTLQATAQLASPSWVRARSIGIYQVVFFGNMTVGAMLAGWIGGAFGVMPALVGFGAAGIVAALVARRWSVDAQAPEAAAPSDLPLPEAPAAELAGMLADDSGRVMETALYTIAPEDRAAFLSLMQEARRVRMRGGAITWRLYENIAHPDRWVELWVVESWTDHLREIARLEPGDRAVLIRAAQMCREGTALEARRYLRVEP